MLSKRSFFLGIALPWILGGIIGFADDQYYELVDYDEEYKEDAGGGDHYDDQEGGGRRGFRQLDNQQDDICKEMKAKVRQLLNMENGGGIGGRHRKGGGRGGGRRRGRGKRRRRGRFTGDKDIDYGNYGGIGQNVGQQGVNKTASQNDTTPKSTVKEDDTQLSQLIKLNRLVREQQKAMDCYASFFQQRLIDLENEQIVIRVDKLGKKPKKSKKRKYSLEEEEDGGGSDLKPVFRSSRPKRRRNRMYRS